MGRIQPPSEDVEACIYGDQPHPANRNAPPKRGVSGVLQGGEICVCCLWEVAGNQAPSGRLNRVEAVSAMCAEPNPTKKTVAM
jgi:hypothetical protein